MKGFSGYIVVLFLFINTVVAQDQENRGTALSAGTYLIGIDGNLPTIDSAFKKLSSDGISGPVILELNDEFYQAPSDTFGFLMEGPIPGAGPDCRIIIKPAGNKNITVEGNSRSVFTFRNVSYLTLDGSSASGESSLTIHSLYNPSYVMNRGVGFLGNSDYNIVQKLTIICDDYLRSSVGIYFQTIVNTILVTDYNIIQNNFIKKAGCGIHLSSMGTSNLNTRAAGNIIRGNVIGSETDSLIGWGIQLVKSLNTVVENNTIQNLKLKNGFCENVNIGINDWAGYGNIIKGNIIHNIKTSSGYTGAGILLSGFTNICGSGNLVYNNMIYDIQSSSTMLESRVAGIQLWNQTYPGIFYNTVYLSGSGANPSGSAALYIHRDVINAEVRNNIFANTRNESSYWAAAVFNYSDSNLNADYNTLYAEISKNNCLIRIRDKKFNSLTEWQVTGNDQNSFSENVNLTSPDLHIDNSSFSLLEGNAVHISGITTDIDGQARNSLAPDIGADEFDGILIVNDEDEALYSQFLLKQNYPNPFNPVTTINYQIPEGGFVTLKIYDILGEEIATLVNEEKNTGRYEVIFNASEMASGVYIYKLIVNDIVLSKKMVLMK